MEGCVFNADPGFTGTGLPPEVGAGFTAVTEVFVGLAGGGVKPVDITGGLTIVTGDFTRGGATTGVTDFALETTDVVAGSVY